MLHGYMSRLVALLMIWCSSGLSSGDTVTDSPGQASVSQVPGNSVVEGSNITLSCSVADSSNTSNISYVWYKDYGRAIESDTGVLRFENVSADVHDGKWCCWPYALAGVRGTYGEPACVSLRVIGPPQPPANVTISTTSESIAVSWSPGFDGGLQQSFVVHYNGSRHDQASAVEVGNRAAVVITDGVKSDTQYSIWVVAENPEGTSSHHRVHAQTNAGSEQSVEVPGKHCDSAIIVASLVPSLLLVLCSAALVYLLRKHRRLSRDKCHQAEGTSTNVDSTTNEQIASRDEADSAQLPYEPLRLDPVGGYTAAA